MNWNVYVEFAVLQLYVIIQHCGIVVCEHSEVQIQYMSSQKAPLLS